ncbi:MULTISPECIES: outer membrane protein assembly factor BamE [unclassified Methylophaga]|jgi:outer membrane protein assembly factor BamE|uniref:outer membrane protein assembly factor BamE n=1 Tax=unclassified Methylophaga TaxID=2629249 RepID=UPI000C972D0A|nr:MULTISPECIES: outer membrane protein assembly factor BamE [unclassified Methylophaga]MAK68197.1 cell envelope protein SmpA [Methylophaga sp.]MAY16662.1 cell envelope protein SmpA [Methylophaga sp.]MBN46273.1 cell envelope protein SmpA [Methylophaga sp.]HCD05378.1 outer membrane protein assembly factor BamE [Methylophaga sp.]|tara:strand:+ start:23621 stop:24199 length:579 start_codon:yes stop_codon:yes gene_type:complete
MKSLLIYSLSLVILTLSACSKDKIPGVYRIDIQQGNQVTQEMLSKLEPGMTKSQVSFVMGTPMLIDVFHPNRWDYIYSFHPGNGSREQRRITLYFDEAETLDYIDGNTRIVENIQLTEDQRTDTNVVVPLTEQKTGIFNSMLNLIGLGEETVETIDDDNETDPAEKEQKEALPENTNDRMGDQPAGQLPDIQ